MARYSQGGVHPLEEKHLKKALCALDDRIALPDSLRGNALLYKLEGVQQDIPTEKKVRELVLPRRRRLHVWAGYAAAFALVVGLLYSLGQSRPAELAPGEIVIGSQATQLAPLEEGGGISPTGAVTGTFLREMGPYLLYYRPSDPVLRSEATTVLMLLDAEQQTVISQVEIPHITDIIFSSADGYLITLHGTCGDATEYTYTIDFTDTRNPILM